MNVLVLGGGGREHALVWKLKTSNNVNKIYCIPGNAGIEKMAFCEDFSLSNFDQILDFIRLKNIGFTVVGPEQPLVEGVVDFLESHDCMAFGPNHQASQLEGSKVFAKDFMNKYMIPTAYYETFTEYKKAINYLNKLPEGYIVVKADGLAAGKGSIVCKNKGEATSALEDILIKKVFKEAGNSIVIEEFLEGEETSLFVITDGEYYKILSPAQDYKRTFDKDLGKNTGGMGSYAPTPVLTEDLRQKAIETIVIPVLKGLKKENINYRGMLYVGLILTKDGPKVVEFNCRFGDPETQVVLPLLKSDLLDLLISTIRGDLKEQVIEFEPGYAICVIAASGGYPDAYEKGKVIYGLNDIDKNVIVFHAGTKSVNDNIVTHGGRVLGVTVVNKNIRSAIEQVYQNINKIKFDGIHYRKDIAARLLKD